MKEPMLKDVRRENILPEEEIIGTISEENAQWEN